MIIWKIFGKYTLILTYNATILNNIVNNIVNNIEIIYNNNTTINHLFIL